MNIHEYQAKAILRNFGVPVPEGHVVYNSNSARDWARRLGDGPYAVKAQIHAGGRGKGGGVKIAKTADEAKIFARAMFGMKLVTHQTGPEGKIVKRVLIEKGCNIADEFYVSFLVDRATDKVTLMASAEGGMDIEEVAAKTPEKIFFEAIDPVVGLTAFQARKVAFKLGFAMPQMKQSVPLLQSLYKTFVEADCSLLEINPLVQTKEGDLLCLDAKINFDDNALFRHLRIRDLRDYDEEDHMEIEASQYDLRDKIKRVAIANELAEHLRVDSGLVLEQFRRAAAERREKPLQATAETEDRWAPGETLLLRCLLHSGEARSEMLEEVLELAAQQNLPSRPILEALRMVTAHTDALDYVALEGRLQAKEQQLLSQLIFSSGAEHSSLAEAREFFAALRRQAWEARHRDLRREIADAENNGDQARVLELLRGKKVLEEEGRQIGCLQSAKPLVGRVAGWS
jgi:hypothetical protein